LDSDDDFKVNKKRVHNEAYPNDAIQNAN